MLGERAAACCFYADIGTIAQKSIRWKVFTKHSLVLTHTGYSYKYRLHVTSLMFYGLTILGRKVTHAYSMVACRTFIYTRTDGILMPVTNAFWDCNRQKQTEQTKFFSISTPFVLFGFRFIWIHSHFMCSGTACDSIDCWRFGILHGLIHIW